MQDTKEIEKDFLPFIPKIPSIIPELINLLKTNEKGNSDRFSEILNKDDILSQRLFAYINYGVSENSCNSIHKGALNMGFHRFKNLVFVFSLFPIFEKACCILLFKHLVITAFMAKNIADKYNLMNPDDAFLLGFLHDIGKVALKNKFGEKYKYISNFDSINKVYTPSEEISEFGYSHCDVAEYMLNIYQMPSAFVNSIKFHHNPLDAMIQEAASIIYIANFLADSNQTLTNETLKIFQYMHISKDNLTKEKSAFKKEINEIFEILEIN